MLRDAFNATMVDPAFAEDVHRQELDLDPRTGEHLAAMVTASMRAEGYRRQGRQPDQP